MTTGVEYSSLPRDYSRKGREALNQEEDNISGRTTLQYYKHMTISQYHNITIWQYNNMIIW